MVKRGTAHGSGNQSIRERLALDLRDNLIHVEASSIRAFGHMNLRRTIFTSAVTAAINIIAMIIYLLKTPVNENELLWQHATLGTHGGMLAVMLVIWAAALVSSRRQRSAVQPLLHHLTLAVIFAGSIALTAFGQLVSPTITPYILACIACALLFLTRPVLAVIYYAAAFILFSVLTGLFTAESNILLSNRINGLVITAICFASLLINWRNNVVGHRQAGQIDKQRQMLDDQNRKLEDMAFHDSLTTLPNRRYFDERVKQEVIRCKRTGRVSCLIILDIDHFKNVNDTYGHLAGDQVLIQLASVIQNSIRESDLVARLGGEEFILLLPETALDQAVRVSEKIRSVIEAHVFFGAAQSISITASFGVCTLDPTIRTHSNYYAACDKALYQAKEKGRNRVECSDPA